MAKDPTPQERARKAYIAQVVQTRDAFELFVRASTRCDLSRARLIRRPTRRNRKIHAHNKAIRADRLREFRRNRELREAHKATYLKAKREAHGTLQEKAHAEMRKLVGVMESGGNNRGWRVTKIIRANGGIGPEPWCGDAMAYCYRLAGSKIVDRRWAAVRLYLEIDGIKRVTAPIPGDLIRFTFDHIGGIDECEIEPGFDQTLEGNTGKTGAVSDSTTGGDGFYVKRRHHSLRKDYLRVTK